VLVMKRLMIVFMISLFLFTFNTWALAKEDAPLAKMSPEEKVGVTFFPENMALGMLQADFWLGKLSKSEKLILTDGEIETFNGKIRQALPGVVYDLRDYPAFFSKQQLLKMINDIPFPTEDRYLKAEKLTPAYYANLRKQLNLATVREENPVSYALTVQRANLRVFPTTDVSYSEPNDLEFDLFQGTAVEAAEPVLVLHRSLDRQWYFVQTYNCRGWLKVKDLAVTRQKKDWLDYVQAKDFLVVTGNRLRLGFNPYSPELSQLELGMGCKLPLENHIPYLVDNQSPVGSYVVKLPTRDAQGELVLKQAILPLNSDVSVGYLPYTRANILRQAFKIQGERYGWGGMFNGRDCSAFVMDVYKSFGILLPRNSGQQRNSAGKTVQLAADLSSQQREAVIGKELLPGATLHMSGHVMLYLGTHQGRVYIIHNSAAYSDSKYKKPDGKLQRLPVNGVVVTDLFLLKRNGKSFLESLTTGKQIE